MNEKVDKFLEHYGILGMKWGVRKGSKKRISEAREKLQSKGSEDYQKARALKGKRLKDMTNAEIQTLTRRMQLEADYKRLNPPTKSRGREFINSALKKVGSSAASEFNKQFVEPRIKDAIEKLVKKAARRSAG